MLIPIVVGRTMILQRTRYLNDKGGFVGVTENPKVWSLMLDYLSGYDEGSQKRKRGEERNERSERRRLVWQQSLQGQFSSLK